MHRQNNWYVIYLNVTAKSADFNLETLDWRHAELINDTRFENEFKV